MQLQLLEIDRTRVTMNPSDIMSLLGDKDAEMDSHTENLIDQYISECLESMAPGGWYVRMKALESDSREEINTESGQFRTGRILSRMLRGSDVYVFFIATAGPGPESLARSLMEEGHYLEAYIADLIGSAIVESVTNQVQEHIRQLSESEGLKITNRYSPGTCSWNVSEQQKLFGLFPEKYCGITLSDSSLMSPIKSVSGIIGIGPSVSYQDYTCEICHMKQCLYRETRD